MKKLWRTGSLASIFVGLFLLGMAVLPLGPVFLEYIYPGFATVSTQAEGLPVVELNADEEWRKGITTIGNSSWVPLDLQVGSAGYAKKILWAKNRFEESFPELEVTGWKIQEEVNISMHRTYVRGLWIDHRPKKISDNNPDPLSPFFNSEIKN